MSLKRCSDEIRNDTWLLVLTAELCAVNIAGRRVQPPGGQRGCYLPEDSVGATSRKTARVQPPGRQRGVNNTAFEFKSKSISQLQSKLKICYQFVIMTT